MLQIDASYGEGGGQLARTAVALSAITGTPLRLDNVRAKRSNPGLGQQHIAAIRAVTAACEARCDGVQLRSQSFSFVPGALRAGTYRLDVGTAGSLTLVLQALLPVLMCARAPSRVALSGGTDVRGAPPLDYFREVLLRLLGQMGGQASCRLLRRGYYPRGGGEVEVSVEPARWKRLALDQPGALQSVEGLAHIARLPLSIAERMRDAALAPLADLAVPAHIAAAMLGNAEASGTGGAVVCWARTAHSVLGAGRVAERGVRAEALGEAAGAELNADVRGGASLDVHAADQVLIYLALAGGRFITRRLSSHALTAIWLIERFMPVRFVTEQLSGGALTRIGVR
jgi:RNA 3'-phosphate cyclase